MSNVQTQGTIRGATRGTVTTGTATTSLAEDASTLVTNVLPGTEVDAARLGTGFYCIAANTFIAGGSAPALAYLGLSLSATPPTTNAALCLQNSTTNTKSLIIASVGLTCYSGPASNANIGLVVRQDLPGSNAAFTTSGALFQGTDGRAYTGGATAKSSGVVLSAIGSGGGPWVPLGQPAYAASGSAYGSTVYVDCWGRFIVRPGGLFAVNAIGSSSGSYMPYIYFYEMVLSIP